MSVLMTRTVPAPGLTHRRARPQDVATWTPHEHAIRTCMYCETKYKEAGAASVCEHWHEGL